ncbi:MULTISPECIES: bisanhydrobacterioruberin hydratase [Halorussus]|uniref:bisanhydrobacterioruberin hydratase n=1 Tax=Halorussus TaxID=1070314 RepID=UPI000E20FC49|nr:MULTISPECIES: bisanhydrobacterioruberin hydratase [Halorussus]NHN58170.1 carotenoid biosynthesis protein [Halorussus sp. JP-T4]
MDRRAVEARLSALVRDNRFTVAVVFPLVGAALFVASREGLLPGWLAMNPALVLFGTVVMRLPLVAGLAPVVDRRAGLALLAVTAYSYAIEYVGVHYGAPYGEFSYRLELGPMVGGVPVGLPVFFLPLVVNAFLLVVLLLPRAGRAGRMLAALGVVLLVDLVLDPAAVGLGFWAYDGGGIYYDVPLSNFRGWLLSGLVAVSLVEWGFDREAVAARLADCEFALDDLVSFVLLWGAMNVYFGNWIAVALATGLAAGLVRTDRFDVAGLGRERPEQS